MEFSVQPHMVRDKGVRAGDLGKPHAVHKLEVRENPIYTQGSANPKSVINVSQITNERSYLVRNGPGKTKLPMKTAIKQP